MKKGIIKKIFCGALSVMMVMPLLAGCAASRPNTDNKEMTEPKENISSNPNRAMGRYTEESLSMPEGVIDAKLRRTQEGLWVFGHGSVPGVWLKRDGSDTWEERQLPESIRHSYISDAAVSKNGELVFICFQKKIGSGNYEYVAKVLDTEGNVKEIFREDSFGNCIAYGPDNMLYCHKSGADCGIYRYSTEDGSEEKLFKASAMVESITFVGNKLLVLDAGEVRIYDMEKGMQDENDSVLDQFVRENLSGFGSYSGAYVALIFGSGEEDVVYLSCSKGLYRHALYGNVMEQLIDGELSSFGDTSKMQQGIVAKEEEDGSMGFEVLFYGGSLIKFTYDASMPTVPDITLKVYGLQDSSAVHQAIALFQKKYPQCYVQYEAALTGVGGANTDDKLKNLNTALLGGNGPDVIIMDGLEEENYSSKGILEDLTPLLESLEEEDALLPNLVEAMKNDGKIYSIPAGFSIPMVAVQEEYAQKDMDIKGLAVAAEELRKQYPDKLLIGSALPDCILTMLAQTEAWSWIEDGTLREDALREYLELADRIYKAESSGVTDKDVDEERAALEDAGYFSSMQVNGKVKQNYYSFSSSLVSVLLGKCRIALGYVNSAFDLCWADQLEEGYVLKPVRDEKGVGFMPVRRLAINSQSDQQEMARAFVKMILSFEYQSMQMNDGAPVNKAALEKSMEERAGYSLGLAGEDADGKPISRSAYWPSEKTLNLYREVIEDMDHSLAYNKFLEVKVVEIGKEALKEGSAAKEDAIDEIRKKTALYLSE